MSEKLCKIYVAGPLFNDWEQKRNKELTEFLESLAYDVFLPQRDVTCLVGVYEQCLTAIDKSDIIIANLDGVDTDSGTAFEMGYAKAKDKLIIGVCTDTRLAEGGAERNLMILGGCVILFRAEYDMYNCMEEICEKGLDVWKKENL